MNLAREDKPEITEEMLLYLIDACRLALKNIARLHSS